MANQHRQVYERVDVSRLDEVPDRPHGPASASSKSNAPPTAGAGTPAWRTHVRWTILPLSVLLCAGQMVFATLAQHVADVLITSTLISLMALGVLMLGVLLLNPLLRLVFRGKVLRPLNRAELMCIFTALLVTSGIGTFGLASPLVPMVATPWNPEWNTAQRGWEEGVLPHLNPALYLSVPEDGTPAQRAAALENIRQFRQGVQPRDAQGNTIARPPQNAPLVEHAVYWWEVLLDIPWWAWVKPLSLWLIFVGACYAMFYSLTYVVLNFWVHREQVIFPLAQLPEQLLPDPSGHRWLPRTLTHGGFWLAFTISFGVLTWNAGVAGELIPGLGRISLGLDDSVIGPMVQGSLLEGSSGGRFSLKFLIIFTAIGLAFLLPTEVSFSLWFYFLIGNVTILMLVWFGYGQTGADFPSELYQTNNIVTAQGGGALLTFAGISLVRAVAELVRLGRDKPWPQKLRISLPVIGLAASLGVMATWLMWTGLPVIWALLVTAILTLLTVGLMRVVAEGGVYWFQAHVGPFHLFNVLGLGKVLSASAAIIPLMPVYAVLFLDAKTFLAPNLANSAKMQEDVGTSRLKFHLNLVLSVVVGVLVSVGLSVFLAHLIGGQQMRNWFYNQMPQSVVDRSLSLASGAPEMDLANACSYIFGGVWVVISLIVRRTMFWFPHPIGYVMLVNPLMSSLWFSFFIGWVIKKFVVSYGGKQTYDRTRPIFIGLILGEALAILFWTLLGLCYEFNPGLSLNRYGG